MTGYRLGFKDAVHLGFITFGLVMFGLLAGRYYLRGAPRELELSPGGLGELSSEISWYGIYFQGQKIGYSNSTTSRQDSFLVITDRTYMSFSMLGSPQAVDSYLRAVADDSLRLLSFVFSISGEESEFGVRGTVEDSVLALQVTSAGETRSERVRVQGHPQLPSTVQLLLADLELEPGRRFSTTVFDPGSLANVPLEVEVLGREKITYQGREVEVWHLRESMLNMPVDTYLDDDGRMLEERSRMGYRVVLEDEGTATSDSLLSRTTDINRLISIVPDSPLPENRRITRLRLELHGVGQDTLGLRGGSQTYEDRVLEVVSAAPDSSALLDTVPAWVRESYTIPSAFIQSEHPRLLALASEIIDLNDSPDGRIRSIIAWMSANIAQKPTFSIPNTLEVLERRSGDCNEFAVLFCSLARAAGIPTRVAMGLVYLEGAFYYHAWCECYLGGWVPVDPIFGQFPADATHLRVLAGDMDRQVEILPLIGTLEISVLDWETAQGAR
ncbi:MAG: transglutaminase domain-containing protein [Candidatus Glassbacteria bacterium]|nr:transglutaminase domain-containing protein [Candidatus Glassbacteria bacterium]